MGRWLWSILVALDQLAHTILSPVVFYRVAHEDETWSSRTGKLVQHHGHVPWKYPIARCVAVVVELIDPGHFARSIEEDER